MCKALEQYDKYDELYVQLDDIIGIIRQVVYDIIEIK